MSSLLEFKEKLKVIYGRNDVYIIPVVKFLLALVILSVINSAMGYMSRLDSLPVVLIASLLCSFLPAGCIIFFGAVFSLLHMYTLSMEVALVGGCLYLVLCLLFFRFSPKDSMAVLLTSLLCAMKIPYVMPVAMGLLGTPASSIAVGCGIVVYYFIHNIVANEQAISVMEAEEMVAKLQLVIDVLIKNKEMLVMILAAAVTIIVVYLIRRLSVAYAWTIAILTGGIMNLIILLVGDLKYDTNVSLGGAILGTGVAMLAAKVIEFFRFCVDYNRTEKVQFEDDEYYYYVKAVPKMTVTAQSRTVKKINTQRRSPGNRSGSGSRNAKPQKTAGKKARRGGAEEAYYEDGYQEEMYPEDYREDYQEELPPEDYLEEDELPPEDYPEE